VGLVIPTNEAGAAQELSALAVDAEQWGYDSLWVTDHVVGVRAMQGTYNDYWLDALTSLTWIAAYTTRVRLGTGVLVVPHRDPVLAAKMLTTLDLLSDGRVDVGVGTGWSRVEFRALGREALYEGRGRATDEALEVMRACWRGGPLDHEGEFFSIRHVVVEPTPVAPLPVWVGGHSAPALRRAARFADVWHPHDLPPDELRTLGDQLDATAGRAIARSVRLAVDEDGLDGLPELLDRYREAGCSHAVLDFRSLPCREVRDLAERAATLLFADWFSMELASPRAST
jgi:probable F420-dependent oxidoreductase